LNPEIAETFNIKARSGVIITGVLQNGPAAQAGVQPGDVITAVDGKKVASVTELLTAVAGLKPGIAAPLDVSRGSEELQIAITPGKRQRPQMAR
ncbi:MAG: PDZ domain-containing protein, partial [Burkholderiales bacterium]